MHASITAAKTLAMTLFAGAGAAVAADIPTAPYKAPPPYYRTYDWTGFYVGANVGGGWGNAKSDFSFAPLPPFVSADNNLFGAVGGVQAGYNWQSGPAVFGFEADFQWSGLKGGLDAPCPPPICTGLVASFDQKMPWFGTVRGRLGYASDGWLIYATGGYAYARFETDAFASAGAISASFARSETRSGWTAGAGIEIALARNWTARLEYLYLDFGTSDRTWTFDGLPPLTDSTRLFTNVVRGGVNYRF
jgi:outer membrane immunogenic protein